MVDILRLGPMAIRPDIRRCHDFRESHRPSQKNVETDSDFGLSGLRGMKRSSLSKFRCPFEIILQERAA